MLAYDESGSPLKLYWTFLDSSDESSFENMARTKENILPEQTAYALYCLKQVVFEDGMVWDNPDYERWMKTYAGKEIYKSERTEMEGGRKLWQKSTGKICWN